MEAVGGIGDVVDGQGAVPRGAEQLRDANFDGARPQLIVDNTYRGGWPASRRQAGTATRPRGAAHAIDVRALIG